MELTTTAPQGAQQRTMTMSIYLYTLRKSNSLTLEYNHNGKKYKFPVYRFKFAHLSQKYTLKSQIKWDTMCPHCGAFANAFVTRLTKEGYWTV